MPGDGVMRRVIAEEHIEDFGIDWANRRLRELKAEVARLAGVDCVIGGSVVVFEVRDGDYWAVEPHFDSSTWTGRA